MCEKYLWDAWKVDENGDEQEMYTDKRGIEDWSVTESDNGTIFDYCHIPVAERELYHIERDFDGRAYVYLDSDDSGEYRYMVESRATCDLCSYDEESCECAGLVQVTYGAPEDDSGAYYMVALYKGPADELPNGEPIEWRSVETDDNGQEIGIKDDDRDAIERTIRDLCSEYSISEPKIEYDL